MGSQLKTMKATIGSLVIRGFISMFAHIYLLQYDLPARRLRVGWDLQQFDLSLTPSSSSVGSWSTRTGGSSPLALWSCVLLLLQSLLQASKQWRKPGIKEMDIKHNHTFVTNMDPVQTCCGSQAVVLNGERGL